MATERAWCPECGQSRDIEETFTDSYYTASGEVGYAVDRLVCDHTIERGQKVIGPAPGDPATLGPYSHPVAESTSWVDLQKASRPDWMDEWL